jgi:hypothetical protein
VLFYLLTLFHLKVIAVITTNMTSIVAVRYSNNLLWKQ